jgi:outer membrane protein assembly factor BamB
MMPNKFLMAVLSCALWPGLPVQGAAWPEFRGPTGQGHADDVHLPVKWSRAENVTWKQSVPGKGWSSPVIAHGRIYVTSAVPVGAGYSLLTLSLDAITGKIIWNSEVFKADSAGHIHMKNSHASPTPVIEGERLYVHFGHQGTACLDLDGNVLWRNTSLDYPPVHGNGGSPIIVDEALIFNCDGGADPFVVALSKSTGKVLWKTPRQTGARNTFSFSTPLLITVNGIKQVISVGSGLAAAYDPAAGEEIWRVEFGQGYSIVPRPVNGNGLVFIATGFNNPSVLAIRPDGKGDVTQTHVAWTLSRSAPNTPSLLLVGEELFMVSDGGIASCLDSRTGKLHWQERIPGGGYSASPLYNHGRVYLQSESGDGVVLNATKQFEIVATNPLEERTLASYAVSDGALFIRTEEHIYRIENSAPVQ